MPPNNSPAKRITPEHLIVGQIVAPFGVKGELKVNILTEFPERFSRLDSVILAPFDFIAPELAPTAALDPKTVRNAPLLHNTDGSPRLPAFKPPKEPTPFEVESTRIHKGQLLLKLSGIDSANDAEALRGYWVLVTIADAKRLPKGAYYIYQIVGLDVYTEAGDFVGKVMDVLTTSANDVYIVKGSGVQDPTGELLLPAVKSIVQSMDVEGGRIIISDPKEWT